MLISELATRTGLPIHTIRFYEKQGLIDERFVERSENNYRHYTTEAVERVGMIQVGQAAGFTLAEIKTLIAAWDAGELTTRAQVEYMEKKVEELTRKIDQLQAVRHYLMEKIAHITAADAHLHTTALR